MYLDAFIVISLSIVKVIETKTVQDAEIKMVQVIETKTVQVKETKTVQVIEIKIDYLIQLYRGGQFCWLFLVKETGVPRETTDLLQATNNIYHIMLYQVHLASARFKLTMLVVIGTVCIGRSHKVVSSTPRLSGIWTHDSDDRH